MKKINRPKYKELFYDLLDSMSDEQVMEYGFSIRDHKDDNADMEMKRVLVYRYYRDRGTTAKLVAYVNRLGK